MLYNKIKENYLAGKKQFAVLIDPDKHNEHSLQKAISFINESEADYIFVGGSLIFQNHTNFIGMIKKETNIPVILFPGSLLQISKDADAILFLSLISGRNPDFLIGNHVIAAPLLKEANIEIIPTGYILIDGGIISSVEYISNTKPIPYNKTGIAIATALAGEMSGQKIIYLEAGSGAKYPVSKEMIAAVKKNISIPLIVGGGLRTEENISLACEAGADLIVVGTAFEEDVNILPAFGKIIHSF